MGLIHVCATHLVPRIRQIEVVLHLAERDRDHDNYYDRLYKNVSSILGPQLLSLRSLTK